MGEADSLGTLLDRLGSSLPSVLISASEWVRLVERVRELPVTLAALPFGFELHLHDVASGADLGVTLIQGSRSAAFFEEAARSTDAASSAARVTGLLIAADQRWSSVSRSAGRRTALMLEYDIGSASGGYPDPGIFFYPIDEGVLVDVGAHDRLQDFGSISRAVVNAAGKRFDSAAARWVEQVCLSLTPGTRIGSVGAFPSRGRGVRLAVNGFRRAPEVAAFLERAGWSGPYAVAEDTVSRFEAHGAFSFMGLHFDVDEKGVGAALGMSFYATDKMHLTARQDWKGMWDCVREVGIAVPAKLDALIEAPTGAELWFGRTGAFTLVRGVHHIKLVLHNTRIVQCKPEFPRQIYHLTDLLPHVPASGNKLTSPTSTCREPQGSKLLN